MKASKQKSHCDSKGTKPIFLFFGRGQDTSFTVSDSSASEPLIPRPDSASIAQITVDTRGLKKPVIEIEFSSVINLLSINSDAKVSLSFILFRSCNDEKPRAVNSWPYEVFGIEDSNRKIRLSTSFVFNYCECLNYSGCCEYFVEVFPGGLAEANIIINNIHIAALASEAVC